MVESFAHIEIGFSDSGAGGGAGDKDGGSLSIVLDEVFNAGQTRFAVNADIYLLILHSDSYETSRSGGVLSRVGTNVGHEVTQVITFAYSDKGSLSHVPSSIVSHRWLGSSAGAVSFDGREVSLSGEGTGMLEVVYRVTADRWRLVSSTPGDVLVSAYQAKGDVRAALTVNIGGGGLSGPIVINVKDFCDDSDIAGAAVYVDGAYKGQTDASGRVNVGMLAAGTHTVSVTAAGYIASANDHLRNDSFTIAV